MRSTRYGPVAPSWLVSGDFQRWRMLRDGQDNKQYGDVFGGLRGGFL